MKADLIISCDGIVDDGFIFCCGVSNKILDFDRAKYSKNYTQLINYLDTVAKLFEGPCFAGNLVMNTVYKLFELEYISKKEYDSIVNFYQWHKRCGLCLKIEPRS